MSIFSKRHYEALAAVIGTAQARTPVENVLVLGILDMLRADNPEFSQGRFRDAINAAALAEIRVVERATAVRRQGRMEGVE